MEECNSPACVLQPSEKHESNEEDGNEDESLACERVLGTEQTVCESALGTVLKMETENGRAKMVMVRQLVQMFVSKRSWLLLYPQAQSDRNPHLSQHKVAHRVCNPDFDARTQIQIQDESFEQRTAFEDDWYVCEKNHFHRITFKGSHPGFI